MIRRFICALTAFLLLSGGALAEEFSGVIRLHVAAADNSAAAQALKLELRDTCLNCAQACLADAPDADSAYIRLSRCLPAFTKACTDRARALGYTGSVRAETGVFEFPDRLYGSLHLPAGRYRALRVTIGEGRGHNWWCMLYPSLCILNEAHAAGEADPDGIIEWLRARLGGAAC